MISRLFEKILLLEKKDHLIKKLNLTDTQKQQLIDYFKKFSHQESKIDWNNKNLTWEDFEPIIQEVSKSQFKKNMSKKEMGGIIEGKDYTELYNKDNIYLAQVLSYKAAVYFGSKNFLGHEGKWCISSNDPTHWSHYTKNGEHFLIFTLNNSKYMVHLNNQTIFDEEDDEFSYQSITENNYKKYFDDKEDAFPCIMINKLLGNLNTNYDEVFASLYCVWDKKHIILGKDFTIEDINSKPFSITDRVETVSFTPEFPIYNLDTRFFIDSRLPSNCTIIFPTTYNKWTFSFHTLSLKTLDFSQSGLRKINVTNFNLMKHIEKVIFPKSPFILTLQSIKQFERIPSEAIEFLNTEYQYQEDSNILGPRYNINTLEDLGIPETQYIEDYNINLLLFTPTIKTLQFKDKSFTTNVNVENLNFKDMKSLERVSLPYLSENISLMDGAFSELQDLEYIDLSNTKIQKLKEYTFTHTPSLKEIKLSSSVSFIQQNVFYESKAAKINLEQTSLKEVFKLTFNYSNFKELKFPTTVTRVYPAIGHRSNIERLDFSLVNPNVKIDESFQYQMNYLKTVILPKGFDKNKMIKFQERYPKVEFIISNSLFEKTLKTN